MEMAIGLVLLPFNIAFLGASVYGLWMIAASIPAYFSILDLGYGVAQVKFVAKYRARGDLEGLNEIVSTLFLVFAVIGIFVLALGVLLAFNLGLIFNLTPDEAVTGRNVLILLSVYAAVGFPFSVFGGVVNGFQRNHLNAVVSIGSSVMVAAVNVGVLLAGYGLVELIAATTAVRILAYVGYRANAYRAFPGLSLRLRSTRIARLREVTGFSAFIVLIDLANKLNYSTDIPIIGAFLGVGAVAVWAVAQRLINTTQDLTTQISGALFPVVVDIATLGETERLRDLFLRGTRLSLAMVIPLATILALLADPLILAWLGEGFLASVPLIWILAAAVVIRVGASTATTVLKGAGEHSFLTGANIAMALGNLGLSIALVRSLGMIGVAIGTLASQAVVSMAVLFPRACRRVETSVFHAVRYGVWPSVWPVIPVVVLLAATRSVVGAGLFGVAAQALAAGVLYSVVFLLFAISHDEREWYIDKVKGFASRRTLATAK
jgi:O-antigen/teichoic acid export membrane protein